MVRQEGLGEGKLPGNREKGRSQEGGKLRGHAPRRLPLPTMPRLSPQRLMRDVLDLNPNRLVGGTWQEQWLILLCVIGSFYYVSSQSTFKNANLS